MTKKITLIIALICSVNYLSIAQSAPVLDALGAQSISDGSMLFFKATATDAEMDNLTFSIIDALPGMDIFPEQGLFSWIPDVSQVGSHDITIEVSDGVDSDNETIAITVTDASASGDVIHVNPNATGSNNGTSWINAYTELKDALDNDNDGDQIWVAAGTHTPEATGDRTESFVINKRIVIYGGFTGDETSRSQRDVILNPTILSGDRARDDETTGNAENSYHVIWMQTTDKAAAIDGVVITAGHADGDASNNAGAAIISFVGNSVLHVKNTIIENNTANFHGVSSILDFGSSSNPSRLIVSNSIFRNNTSSGNVISVNADAITTPFTRVDIIHSNIVSNDALVIDSQRESIITRFYNSLIIGHTDNYLRALSNATNEFYNCVFDNDPETMSGTGISVFEDNLIDQTLDLASDHQFTIGSSLRNSGKDNYANLLGANPKDIAGNDRINEGSTDIGAVEFTNYTPTLNSSFDPGLVAMDEDATESDCMSISSLIESNGGIIADRNYQSIDGIAIVDVDDSNGDWQYSVNGGDNWIAINPIGMDNALLLTNSVDAKLRFIPDANFNGTIINGLSFKAWDQHTGNSEDKADATISGGNTVFSGDTETVSITINPINDAPTLAVEDQTIEEAANFAMVITADDVDNDDLTYSIDATSMVKGIELTSGGSLSWKPTNSDIGNHLVTIVVTDGEFNVESTFTIIVTESTARIATVTGINDETSPSFNIYPNPTVDYVEISPNTNEDSYDVRLYSLQGQVIYQDNWETKDGTFRIDLNAQFPGIYLLNLQSSTTTISQRIIKQ